MIQQATLKCCITGIAQFRDLQIYLVRSSKQHFTCLSQLLKGHQINPAQTAQTLVTNHVLQFIFLALTCSHEQGKKEMSTDRFLFQVRFGPLLENVAGTYYLQEKYVMCATHVGMFQSNKGIQFTQKQFTVKRNVPTACEQQAEIWVLGLHPG